MMPSLTSEDIDDAVYDMVHDWLVSEGVDGADAGDIAASAALAARKRAEFLNLGE
jgi:hypothetical protein